MSKLLRFLILLTMLPVYTGAQTPDYIDYQRAVNRADARIRSNDLDGAAAILDSLGRSYDFVYAQHCFKALQVACVRNDHERADYWLARCLRQGVPLWMLRYNELTKKALAYPNTQHTLAHSDSLHAVYEASINLPLSRAIDSLMAMDMKHTRRVNDGFILFRHTLYGLQWIHNNTRVFRRLSRIIEQYGFPGERVIGLGAAIQDSAELVRFMRNEGPSLTLAQRMPLFMMLHYTSTRRPDITPMLLPSVANGNLPANQFARINEYLVINSGKGRGGYKDYWEFDRRHTGNTDTINRLRDAIGLNTVEEQRLNDSLRFEWRKTKTMNSQIALE